MSLKNTKVVKPIYKMIAVSLVSLPLLTGCIEQRVINNGAIVTQDQLDLIPVGSSRDQVLLALGTPSTKGQFGSEVFYYISQKITRTTPTSGEDFTFLKQLLTGRASPSSILQGQTDRTNTNGF